MAYNQNSSVGKIGEAAFAELCARAELIINKSDEDATGWDYFVQSELNTQSSESLDTRDLAFGAFVQVKSSRAPAKSVSVKLSNCERMITEPRPAFFAVYHVAKDNSIISLNVAHVNDAAISIILTKLRKASTSEAKASHKIYVEIPLISMDTCPIRTPSDLKAFFSSVTKNGNFNYVKNKIEQVKSLGYEDNAFSGSFSLPTKTAVRDLVSAMLGEIPNIVVNDLKLTENRFGIEKEIAFSKRAVLSIEIVNKESCDVVFTSNDKKLSANFTCSLAIPQIPNMSEDDFKVRIECDHFSFFVSKALGIHKLKFSSLGSTRFEWPKLKHIFILQKIFKQGRFEINCYIKGRKVASGRSDSQLDTAQRTDFTLTIIRAIDFLCSSPSFGYHAKFNIDELNKTIKEIKEYFI